MTAKNPSEKFVYEICSESFFSLWSYPNPLRGDGHELCDILVQFRNDLIIISVKDIKFNAGLSDGKVAAERWRRSAIDKSIKQILGAERYLKDQGSFKVEATPDGGIKHIEEINQMRIYRVAVALGSQGIVPFGLGASGDAFVHVLEEDSFSILMHELDTLSDFVQYLSRKEDFISAFSGRLIVSGEENLLALYLRENRSFVLPDADNIHIEAGNYSEFTRLPQYINKKKEDRFSYLVDKMINEFIETFNEGSIEGFNKYNLASKTSLTDLEKALAIVVSEDRLGRRLLGRSIYEVATSNDLGARFQISPGTGVLYVIYSAPGSMSREARRALLFARCFVALGICRDKLDKLEAVGIATENYVEGEGHSFDLFYLYLPHWTSDDQKEMGRIQNESGIFRDQQFRNVEELEYPEGE